VNTAGSPIDHTASREELCRRIDDELARLGDIHVSSWMMAEAPPEVEPDDGRPLASEVELDAALGGVFWRAREGLERVNCFHVIGPEGTLVAVLQPGAGPLYARARVARDDLAALTLHRRPVAAGTAPHGYRQTSFQAVLWRFALFGLDGMHALPNHYRQLPLRLRQLPPLDRGLVAGRHFKLMHLLLESGRTFTELQENTGLSDAQLSRDLAALRLVGSLTVA